nr:MFS transporter [bacterium]
NGAFQSMGFPPVARGLVHWFSSEERATKWTIWSSSHTAGTFFVGILVAFLLKYAGWKSAFYVPGIIGVVTSLFLMNRLRDRPVSIGLPTIEDYHGHVPPVVADKGLSHLQILKKYVFGNPYIWALCFAYIFVYLVRFGTLDWATKFMYDVRGIDKVKVAMMWSIMPLFGMPGGIVAGIVSDRFFRGRCTPTNIIYLLLLAASILGFYLYAGMENFYLTCFLLGCIGFFVDGPQNLVGGVQVSRITASESVSAACGLSGLFGYIGAIISGVGLAFVTENFGWAAMYGVCIASCFVAAFLVALTWKKESAHLDAHRRRARSSSS